VSRFTFWFIFMFCFCLVCHGCEAWNIKKKVHRELEAAEMWFIRRMLRISWTARKTNEEVLREAEVKRQIYQKLEAGSQDS